MREALLLAREAAADGEVPVGCVITLEDRIVGRGRNRREKGKTALAHAELEAIGEACRTLGGWRLWQCTLYVTLEPCSHWGRTPPCALAIVEHRIGRVVTSVADPNPQVAGRGLKMIRDAGIEVTEGVRSKEGWLSNRGFLTRMTTGRPWVRMKCAATLDGRTAFPDGRSQWITGPAAREDSQYWRAVSGAVVTGIGTVLADNPKMTVRLPDQVRFPFRVVVDPRLETPVGAEILKGGGTVLVCAQAGEEAEAALVAAGAEVLRLPDAAHPGRVDLGALLDELGRRQVNEVHLEAGAGLNGSFLSEGLVDEIVLYTAPCLFGSGMPVASVPLPEEPGLAHRWTIEDFTQIGADLRVILRR